MRKTTALLSALLALCVSTAASAQTADELKRAEKMTREGMELYGKNKIVEAVPLLRAAFAIVKDDKNLRNLAIAEFFSKQNYVEAYDHIREYLSRGSVASDSKTKGEFEGMLKEAFDKTGHVQLKASDGTNVMLDDHQNLGNAPFADTVTTMPGKHAFTAKKDQSADRKEIDIPAGQITAVEWPVAAPVTSSATTGNTTAVSSNVPPDGGNPASNTSTPPPMTETYRPVTGYAVPVVLGIAGVALIVTGALVATDSQNTKDSALSAAKSGACSPPSSAACASAKNDWSGVSGSGAAAVGLYVGGGVLAAAAIVSYLVWPKATREKATAYLAPSLGGFVFGGSFQ